MASLKHAVLCGICPILAAFLSPGASYGQETGDGQEFPLKGILHLGTRNCEAGQPMPCAVYFELDGEAARQVYENMRTPAKTDLCTEGFMKTDASGLHCYRSGSGDHGCYFGYDFNRRKIVEGDFSC